MSAYDDALKGSWTASTVAAPLAGPVDRDHPLASQGGVDLLGRYLVADAMWRKLTARQRDAVNAPETAHPLSVRALSRHGLMDDSGTLTAAGRLLADWGAVFTRQAAAKAEA